MPERLVPILRTTALSLKRALVNYWPIAGEGYELAEANSVMHLGIALSVDGFDVYGQVPVKGGGFIDMLALHPERRLALAVEGKRLWSDGTAGSLAKDLERLRALSLTSARPGAQPIGQNYECMALAVATTRKPAVEQWWLSRGRGQTPPVGDEDGGWFKLAAQLQTCDHVFEPHLLGEQPEVSHRLLVALARLPAGIGA